jgi:hypothetical protein
MSGIYTYSCSYCKKSYNRKSAYNNHLINCKFQEICKSQLSNSSNISIDEVNTFDNAEMLDDVDIGDIQNMTIDNKSIFKMLIVLHNKYEKLEADYNELKKYVNITKNKISILEYLNSNCINECQTFDYIDFINYITIGIEELDMIFVKDYVVGIYEIIINAIEKLRSSDINIPIKAFNNKDGILYIYLKNIQQWIIMDEENLNKIIKYFDKKLLNLFLQWKIDAENKLDSDSFGEIYIKNMKKILGGNYNNRNRKIMIKNKLYKHLKVSIKNVISFEFE